MAVVELTQDNFEQIITGNELVLVDFWAPWCAPCRAFAPIFEAAAEKYPDVVFGKVNTDEEQELAGAFQIRSIPTLTIFRQQIGIFSQAGSLPASALDQVIEQAKALDMEQVRAEIREGMGRPVTFLAISRISRTEKPVSEPRLTTRLLSFSSIHFRAATWPRARSLTWT